MDNIDIMIFIKFVIRCFLNRKFRGTIHYGIHRIYYWIGFEMFFESWTFDSYLCNSSKVNLSNARKWFVVKIGYNFIKLTPFDWFWTKLLQYRHLIYERWTYEASFFSCSCSSLYVTDFSIISTVNNQKCNKFDNFTMKKNSHYGIEYLDVSITFCCLLRSKLII